MGERVASRMRRRDVLGALGGTVVLRPRSILAQTAKVPTVGILAIESPAAEEFRQGLQDAMRELGYSEGKNIHFEFLSDPGVARLPELATRLVQRKADIIVTWFTPAARAAKAATRDIPIVMGVAGNPVESGLVASLAQPGGNVTGIAGVGGELAGKMVELFHEMLPSARRIVAHANALDTFSKPYLASIQHSGEATGTVIEPVMAEGVVGLEKAFAAAAAKAPDGMITQPSLGLEIVPQLALKYRIPAGSILRDFAEHGGLMSYSTVYVDVYRSVANYVSKILKGAKPAGLPVEQPSKFALTINLKTAKALKLDLASSFLSRVDDVIE